MIEHEKLKENAIYFDEEYGTQYCFVGGELHTSMSDDGYQYWYKNGLLHREDGPAYTNCVNGIEEWWTNGKFQRLLHTMN